ncbi:sulfite reductase subunit A [Microbulbifer flavimaris]|uniref:Sulfite reductase subunit A n=1 Tax=Microbulbifer flavimaris TaxID=1781068 RepID=A0ABX4I505_9GAMM|nr:MULTISPECIES: 4Fe-4S dicluster domain-containing protein [Microbulbifer]KUJ84749.1 sulfite reductase subunit A [Microbulbifer sp. ZGT114]PCO06843.1 sulfite reductase subunit A [Microbulbifer flavimaris]
MAKFVLQAEDLDLLIQAIRADGYQVLGPVIRDQAIAYGAVEKADDLPRGWTDEQEKGHYRLRRRNDDAYFGYAASPQSWKQYLQLPRRQVWQARKSDLGIQVREVVDEAPAVAFLGVRSCELHAIAIQDRVFVDAHYRNDSYVNRRAEIFTVAVNCTSAAATCFCTSMHTGPSVTLPSDLAMTEVITDGEHYFLVGSDSYRGRQILKQLPVRPATAENLQMADKAIQAAVQQMEDGPRHFDSSDLKELLYRNLDSPAWDEVAERCLSCANCTMACPTCFCSTVEDSTDLEGAEAERWERWDSCFTGEFSHLSGGAVRPDTRSRYRQWMTHKLASWYDQFGSSGCVGCGRCITWCPVGIDLTEQVSRIRELEEP